MAAPDFQVEYKLCLNGLTVPVETKNIMLVDPLDLADTNSLILPDTTEANLVSFKASGDMNWLCKSLQLPGGDGSKYSKGRWWAHNSTRVPLLMEIKEAIKNLKQQKKANQPTDHQCLILLEIRGQLLYAKNSSTAVTLGLTKEPGTLNVPHPDIDPLVWFCTQLQRDIDEHLQHKPEKKAASVPAEHEEQVQEVLEKLKAHPQCQLVHFVPARMLFRIRKKSLHGPATAGETAEFKVLGLHKWRRTEGASESSEDPFQKCLAMGLNFLSAPDEASAPSAPPAPDSQE